LLASELSVEVIATLSAVKPRTSKRKAHKKSLMKRRMSILKMKTSTLTIQINDQFVYKLTNPTLKIVLIRLEFGGDRG